MAQSAATTRADVHGILKSLSECPVQLQWYPDHEMKKHFFGGILAKRR
jgi:hypothetical protein